MKVETRTVFAQPGDRKHFENVRGIDFDDTLPPIWIAFREDGVAVVTFRDDTNVDDVNGYLLVTRKESK